MAPLPPHKLLFLLVVGFRSVKVRWDVYERLRRLALERGMTIADVVA